MILPDEDWSEFEGPDPASGDTEPLHGADELPLDRVGRLKKAPTAFRTISEVADDLHVPQHVLRFWETRFPQVKPLKRGGGRRYYRPDDVVLLRRISDLLYIQGYTIKGVQRLLIEGDGSLQDDPAPGRAGEGDPDQADTAAEPEQAEQQARAEAHEPAHDGMTRELADQTEAPVADELQLLREAFRETLSLILDELEAIRRQLVA